MHSSTGILDEPEIRGAALPLTVAQYHRLSAEGIVPERTELLQGVVIEQMTKSPLHTFLVQRLTRWIESALPAGWFVRKEEPLTLADSEPEPDIAVVAGGPEDYRTAHPATAALVVEVAIATLGIDRAKADIYAKAGIPEYWIVIPDTQTVEILRQPGPSGYGERLIVSAADATLQPGGLVMPPLPIKHVFGS
jgi:Uma2 family endonuclease